MTIGIGIPRRKLGVFVGRFQPYHIGHQTIVDEALKQCDVLALLVGSAGRARTTYNPFIFAERAEMVRAALPIEQRDRVTIMPLRDSQYNNDQWKLNVQTAVADASSLVYGERNVSTALVGHAKDHTSFYLKMFPQWGSFNVPNYMSLSATHMRSPFFLNGGLTDYAKRQLLDEGHLAPSTVAFLHNFEKTEAFGNLVKEFRYIEHYREPYLKLPYEPFFVTVDAVIVQSGHVLTIERDGYPGKGLRALPGGFVERGQTIEEAIYAEVSQETGLGFRKIGRYDSVKVYDDPHRSQLGRLITHAHLFRLPDASRFPSVTAANDPDKGAKKPEWIEIGNLREDQMHDDHFAIVHHILGTTTGTFQEAH